MSLLNLFLTSLLLLLIFQIQRMIYRVWLHPLAGFPGPKLAAATSLYASYFNLVKGGTYTAKLPELHQRYGPIVRTYPNELHIHDKEAYDQVFRIGTPFDKYRPFYDHPLGEGSHFNMTGLKDAKSRRDVFASYLSKSSVRRMEPLLKETLMHFISILAEAGQKDRIVNLTKGYHSLTTDAMMNYGWQRPFGAIDFPDFQFPTVRYMNEFLIGAVLVRTFHPIFGMLLGLVFRWPILAKVSKSLSQAVWLRQKCRELVLDAIKAPDTQKTLFSNFGDVDLRLCQTGYGPVSIDDLVAETLVFLVGGEESTANTLIHGTFHILRNGEIKDRLLQELFETIPDINQMPDSETLEKLPYLTAVIKEALRFGHGAPGRLPRVAPTDGATLCGRYIPPKTIISMSHYVYHVDETVFPDAHTFKPERWLTGDFHFLDKHLLSFSRGSRGCIGINLAYSELYLSFAYIFRLLKLEVHDTTRQDLEWRDFYAPMTKGHLKVAVRGRWQ